MKKLIRNFCGGLAGAVIAATPASALAAGTSSFSLHVSGNTISVYETSSVAVDTVEADFAYTDSQSAVSSISVATGSTFTTCLSTSSASIVCSALGGSITGTNLVATLTINLKSGVSSATVMTSMLGSSAIDASGTDTLDHSSLPSATYSYTAPAPTPTPTPTTSSTKPSTKTSSAPVAAASSTPQTSGNVAGDSTTSQQPAAPKQAVTLAAATNDTPASQTGINRTLLSALLVILLAASVAAYRFIRRPVIVAPVTTYTRKPTAKKSAAKRSKR